MGLKHDDSNTTIHDLLAETQVFLKERDWEKYHNHKDLAESICIEAAELLQLFQWLSTAEVEQLFGDKAKMAMVKEELADVMIYCLSMANALKIDLSEAVLEKLQSNRKKYPADLYFGKAHL